MFESNLGNYLKQIYQCQILAILGETFIQLQLFKEGYKAYQLAIRLQLKINTKDIFKEPNYFSIANCAIQLNWIENALNYLYQGLHIQSIGTTDCTNILLAEPLAQIA